MHIDIIGYTYNMATATTVYIERRHGYLCKLS